jgi:hypothetical protein
MSDWCVGTPNKNKISDDCYNGSFDDSSPVVVSTRDRFKTILLRNIINYESMDKFYLWLVWKLPRRLIMWAAVRVISHATTNQWSNQVVPSLKAMDALERWDK